MLRCDIYHIIVSCVEYKSTISPSVQVCGAALYVCISLLYTIQSSVLCPAGSSFHLPSYCNGEWLHQSSDISNVTGWECIYSLSRPPFYIPPEPACSCFAVFHIHTWNAFGNTHTHTHSLYTQELQLDSSAQFNIPPVYKHRTVVNVSASSLKLHRLKTVSGAVKQDVSGVISLESWMCSLIPLLCNVRVTPSLF